MNYLILGDNGPYVENELNKIVKKHIKEKDEFNYVTFDMENTSIDDAIEDAMTLPFMCDHKIVVLKNPYFLTSKRIKSEFEFNEEVLLSYLEKPSDFTDLVILATGLELDERKSFIKKIKKLCDVITVEVMNEKQIPFMVEKIFAENDVKIEKKALDELCLRCGKNATRARVEAEKLCTYSNSIVLDDVINLVSRELDDNVFNLIEGIVMHDTNKAMQTYYDIKFMNSVDPVVLISSVANQLRFMYQVGSMKDNGYRVNEIASALNVKNPYRVEITLKKLNRTSTDDVLVLLNRLSKLDVMIKKGKIDKNLGFELFLLGVEVENNE
jgi:DNA polymerase-3 subunit delta